MRSCASALSACQVWSSNCTRLPGMDRVARSGVGRQRLPAALEILLDEPVVVTVLVRRIQEFVDGVVVDHAILHVFLAREHQQIIVSALVADPLYDLGLLNLIAGE